MSEFLAEAKVVITPDTSTFRPLLLAELTAIQRTLPPVVVPVSVVSGAPGAAAVATTSQAALAVQLQQTGAAATQAAASTTRLTTAEHAADVAARKLALSQEQVANAASAVGAAQTVASRSTAAIAAAQRAVDLALRTQNTALIAATQNTLALAEAQAVEATSALSAARAQATHAATLSQIQRAGLASAASMAGLRGAVLTAGAAFLGATIGIQAFSKGVQAAADLERELNVFRVTAQATATEMGRVAEEARNLGRDVSLPAVSAADAATAMTELAKAGLTVEDSLAGARGVLQLSTAAQISVADATTISANALNAFGLEGEQAVRVADLLANAANESQGEITDMGLALRQSATVARQLGLSVSDTVTFLTLLARAGLSSSDAGTSLRVALTRLIAPTERSAEQLERLGIALRDTQGNLRPDVFAQLGAAMEDLGRAEQARILFEIFGQDAQRAAAVLARSTTPALNETRDALDRSGAAAELAGARTEGFSGAAEGLSSNLETLGTNLSFLLPGLTALAQGFSGLVGGINLAADLLRKSREELRDTGDESSGFEKRLAGVSSAFGDLAGGIRDLPGLRQVRDDLDGISQSAPDAAQNVRTLSRELEAQGSVLSGDTKLLTELIERLGRLPTDAEIVKLTLDPRDARGALIEIVDEARKDGTLSAEALAEAFRRESQANAGTLTEPLRRGLSDFTAAAADAGQDAGEAFVASFNAAQVTGQLQAQRTAVAQAQAFGETGLEELIKERDRIDRILESARRPTGPALESLLNERLSVINEIERILEQAASAKEDAADRIRDAEKEADRKFLDAFSAREGRLENQKLIASASESLQDDLRAEIALRNFYAASIREIRKTVQDAKLRAEAIQSATRDLIRAEQEVRKTRRELREAREQERRDRLADQRESVELDLQIAQATGNTAAQRRALEAEIKFYQERIRATRAGSLQRKRWLLELRRAQKELRELKGEQDTTRNTAAELFFSTLQAQQGFAANLLGNLIPAGQTGGLVGNVSPPRPDQGVATAAAAQQGKDARSPTSGQAQTTNSILLRILRALENRNREGDSPEAKHQRRVGSAGMDTQ